MPESPKPCVRVTQQKLDMATITQLASDTANFRLMGSASFMEELGKDSAVVSKETPWRTQLGKMIFFPKK